MIVVRSRKKREYLEALHRTDLTVGATPSLGAHASKRDIQQFLTYFTNLFIDEVSYDIHHATIMQFHFPADCEYCPFSRNRHREHKPIGQFGIIPPHSPDILRFPLYICASEKTNR